MGVSTGSVAGWQMVLKTYQSIGEYGLQDRLEGVQERATNSV